MQNVNDVVIVTALGLVIQIKQHHYIRKKKRQTYKIRNLSLVVMQDTLSPMSWLIFCLAITKAFLVFSSFSVICCLSVSSWEALSCSSCLSLVSSVCSLEDCSWALRPSVSRSATTCYRPERHDTNTCMQEKISIYGGALSRFLLIFIVASYKLWPCNPMKYGLLPCWKAKKLHLLN